MRFTLTKATPLGQAEQSGWTLFRAGLMKGLPIAVGYFAIATTFGLIAVSVGLNVWQAAAMSLFVFAGASQFVALELMAAGTGMAEIVVTTFILNLRHLLMSTVIAERLKATSKWSSILSFGITDETFVVSTVSDSDVPNKKGATLSPAYLGGIMLIAYSWWFAGTVVGSLFARMDSRYLSYQSRRGLVRHVYRTARSVRTAFVEDRSRRPDQCRNRVGQRMAARIERRLGNHCRHRRRVNTRRYPVRKKRRGSSCRIITGGSSPAWHWSHSFRASCPCSC